jgi:hypothetical protein
MQSTVNSSGPTQPVKSGVIGGARRGLRDITNVATGGNGASGKAVVKPAAAAAAKGSKSSATTFFTGSDDTTALSARSTDQSEVTGMGSTSDASAYNRREADDIDARDASNPLMVTHYVQEIYAHMREKEISAVSSTYMQRQPHINEKMRAILIDWLVC